MMPADEGSSHGHCTSGTQEDNRDQVGIPPNKMLVDTANTGVQGVFTDRPQLGVFGCGAYEDAGHEADDGGCGGSIFGY